LLAVLLASVPACADSLPSAGHQPIGPSPDAASRFDPSAAGAISGQVVWSGELPAAAPFTYRIDAALVNSLSDLHLRRNPYASNIDPSTRAVRDVLVYLRGVDVERARPWNHTPVRVEQGDLQLEVVQGDRMTPIGFVRRGDSIEMVSRDPRYHALHASGAEYFTLAFPDPDQPLTRVLDHAGVVELTSGAGYYWMRAYLIVDDHPYYTCTDSDGRFTLAQVPPGRYDLVCWMPNCQESGHDRDPETGFVTRIRFKPSLMSYCPIELGTKQELDVKLVIGIDALPR
jgi:hypothetical protein